MTLIQINIWTYQGLMKLENEAYGFNQCPRQHCISCLDTRDQPQINKNSMQIQHKRDQIEMVLRVPIQKQFLKYGD